MVNTTRPAIGCTRISTDRQRDGYGQDVQATEITRYALGLGYDLLEIVPEVQSGAADPLNRAAVQRYYQLAEQTPGLTFIFPRVDRIGRRAELILNIVRELHQRGAEVQAIGVPMDLREKEGMLLLTMLAGVAEYGHRDIRQNMQSGMRSKARKGLWPHGSPPWGYELERDARGVATLPRPVPERAAAVLRLFELAVDHGEATLLGTMRAEGWPAPTEKGWVRKSVHNILTNSLYSGRRVYQGITIEYPAIVPPELVERVQQARTQRRTSGGPLTAQPLLFTGHLRCVCGAAMGRDEAHARQTGTGAEKSHYTIYRCWKGKSRKLDAPGQPHQVHAPQMASHRVDPQFWAALTVYLTDPNLLAEIVAPTAPVAPLPSGRVQELEAAITRAYEPLTAGAVGYTLSIAQDLARPYAEELARLRAEHAARAVQAAPDAAELAAQFQDMLSQPMTFDDQRELLQALRVQLIVGKGGVEAVQITLP